MSAYFAIDGIVDSYRKMSDLNLIQKGLGDVSIVDDINGIPIIRINTKKWDRKDKILFVLESRIGNIIDEVNNEIDDKVVDIIKFNEEYGCFVIDADDLEKLNEKFECWCKSGGICDNGEWDLPILVVSKRK